MRPSPAAHPLALPRPLFPCVCTHTQRRVATAYDPATTGRADGWTEGDRPPDLKLQPGDEIEIFAAEFELGGGGFGYGSCNGKEGLFPIAVLENHLDFLANTTLTAPRAGAGGAGGGAVGVGEGVAACGGAPKGAPAADRRRA